MTNIKQLIYKNQIKQFYISQNEQLMKTLYAYIFTLSFIQKKLTKKKEKKKLGIKMSFYHA